MADLFGQIEGELSSIAKSKFIGTSIKPLLTTFSSVLLSRYWYLDSTITILGLSFNQQYFYSGIIGLTSFFEENLKWYLLPNIVEKQLATSVVNLTSPFVVGGANLLANQGLRYFYTNTFLGLRPSFNAFALGFLSEMIGVYLYQNIFKKFGV